MSRLEEDLKNNTTHAWTSVPEKITLALQAMGYDGVKDTGGKMGTQSHTVWIAFEPTQIKSAIGNRGTYDITKKDYTMNLQKTSTPKAQQADQIISSIDKDTQKVLFHSGTRDQDESINENWLNPRIGEWVTDVLNGATDDDELIEQIKAGKGAVWLDEVPRWVSVKVANKIGKQVSKVTRKDIEDYGQLTIIVADIGEDLPSWKEPKFKKYDEEEYIYDLNGKEIGRYTGEPFGLEPGDIYSEEDVEPAITLTGKDLVAFLDKHYPGIIEHNDRFSRRNMPSLDEVKAQADALRSGIQAVDAAMNLTRVKKDAERYKPNPVTVTDPNGHKHTFPNEAMASAFRVSAGLEEEVYANTAAD
jgi:hypothetical protein